MRKFTTSLRSKSIKSLLSAAVLTLCASSGYAQITDPAPYCGSKFFANYNMFENIRIKGTQLNFGPKGSWTSPNDFGYFNSFVFPELKRGDTASVELNVYAVDDMEPIYFALWIDYNQNKVFESAELVLQNSNTIMAALPTFTEPVKPIHKVITIPGTAVAGPTRARLLRGTNLADPFAPYDAAFSLSSCNDESDMTMGNTYDFNVIIADGTTSIENIGEHKISGYCFPNPAHERITISLGNRLQQSTIALYDLNNKMVKTVTCHDDKVSLSVADIPSGIYYLKANLGNEVITEKIIITH